MIAGINVIRGLRYENEIDTYSDSSLLDTEIESIANKNVILIGNPCQNRFSRQLYGKTVENCASGINRGEKIVELFKNGKSAYALVISGYNEDDVRAASVFVERYKDTKMSGTSYVMFHEQSIEFRKQKI